MFGTYWSTFVDASVNSQIQQFLQIQRQKTQTKSIIELIRDLMVTYILTKFGADWLMFGNARV